LPNKRTKISQATLSATVSATQSSAAWTRLRQEQALELDIVAFSETDDLLSWGVPE
jgi:hypothetical protein